MKTYNNSSNAEIEIDGKVIDITKTNETIKLKVRHNLLYYYIYTERKDIEIGTHIKVKGTLSDVKRNTRDNAFNYLEYLKHERVKAVLYASDIEVVKNGFSLHFIRYKLYEYIDNNIDGEMNVLVKGLLLGDTSSFSDEFNNALKKNGIMHLFAISGLHISLFIMIVSSILHLFKMKDEIINIIICILLFFYLYLTNFSPSILRASLMFLIRIIFNKFKINARAIDICGLSFILLVFINPYIAYSFSFILSYLASFTIIVSSNYIHFKNKSLNILALSVCINTLSLPVIINFNNEINLASPILNILYISLTSMIIIPMCIICLIFPFSEMVFSLFARWFFKLVDITQNINILLNLPSFKDYQIVIYILLILFIFYALILNKKGKAKLISASLSLGMYLLFIVVLFNSSNFYNKNSMYFLSLHDGEACVIRNKSHTVLIDLGDGYNDEVYSYLKSEGIRKIDAIFISHDHLDHYGGIYKINEEMKVGAIYVSEYNYNDYAHFKNSKVLKKGSVIKINDILIRCLLPNEESDEENDNSMVLYLEFCKHSFLFTGDITSEMEKELIYEIEKYNLSIDFLKVAHHGSNTSSSPYFISNVNAKYALIMCGESRDKFFPSESILYLLKANNMEVISTKDKYSFKIVFKKDAFKFVYN